MRNLIHFFYSDNEFFKFFDSKVVGEILDLSLDSTDKPLPDETLRRLPKYLSTRPHITEINLQDQRPYDDEKNINEIACNIAKISYLTSINFNNCSISDDVVKQCLKNPNLKTLRIAFNIKLTDSSFDALMQSGLQKININYCAISKEKRARLLEHCTQKKITLICSKIAVFPLKNDLKELVGDRQITSIEFDHGLRNIFIPLISHSLTLGVFFKAAELFKLPNSHRGIFLTTYFLCALAKNLEIEQKAYKALVDSHEWFISSDNGASGLSPSN